MLLLSLSKNAVMTFKEAVYKKLNDSMSNYYGIENYSEARYGAYKEEKYSLGYRVRNLVSKTFGIKRNFSHNIIDNYSEQLELLYNNLNDPKDKELLIALIAFRVLGFRKVMLPTNNSENDGKVEEISKLKVGDEVLETGFRGFKLDLFDLASLGYDAKLYFNKVGILIDFVVEQYAYKRDGQVLVGTEPGDTVLDIGGCWGDTAVYFGCKAGPTGKVYSFEFIPNNIKLHKKNVGLNPALAETVTLVPNPVWSESDKDIYFEDDGPASAVSFSDWPESDGTTKTISVDDFVERNNVERVDFIKMDIEGAEPYALEGAIKTIKKFKPKLAIAIYHSIDDFVNIPKWILDLDVGYELNLGHFTIFAEETVIFASVKN